MSAKKTDDKKNSQKQAVTSAGIFLRFVALSNPCGFVLAIFSRMDHLPTKKKRMRVYVTIARAVYFKHETLHTREVYIFVHYTSTSITQYNTLTKKTYQQKCGVFFT
eukprot:GEMP01104049.1.p2 GENE.GEMP01104049.1~~GEMP01104049.1.p2  ORF type:complete len:107 (-),score=1.21 GEMP01104049.1:422-742(-)